MKSLLTCVVLTLALTLVGCGNADDPAPVTPGLPDTPESPETPESSTPESDDPASAGSEGSGPLINHAPSLPDTTTSSDAAAGTDASEAATDATVSDSDQPVTSPEVAVPDESEEVKEPEAEAPEAPAAAVALVKQNWRVIHINETKLPGEAQKRPTMLIDPAESRIFGFSGVNRYFGGYKAKADGSISFDQIGMSMMGGEPEAMELESSYTKQFDQIDNYRIVKNQLELRAGELVLLRFEKIAE